MPLWSHSSSVPSPWCVALSSTASGWGRTPPLTRGASSSSASGRWACSCCWVGSPSCQKPPGGLSRPGPPPPRGWRPIPLPDRPPRAPCASSRAGGGGVLGGHAFERGGRLPYQPLGEALRERLEAENAREDLLEDVWLAELARLLPELRVRYPDLPAPTEDELTAKGRLFEAVARLLDALCKRAPLLLLVDDLQWADEASLDLLRYLGHFWKEHGSRVLCLCTVRSEELEPKSQLSTQLANLGRDLPVTQVSLQPLSQTET